MLAHHALEAGDQALAIDSGIRAAQTAVAMSAPEEAVRLIDATLTAASDSPRSGSRCSGSKTTPWPSWNEEWSGWPISPR